MKTKPKCLTATCQRRRTIRGLCRNCYQSYRRFVAEKKTSWSELEQIGLAYSAKKGRPSGSGKTLAYRAAKNAGLVK